MILFQDVHNVGPILMKMKKKKYVWHAVVTLFIKGVKCFPLSIGDVTTAWTTLMIKELKFFQRFHTIPSFIICYFKVLINHESDILIDFLLRLFFK
jgi:hypothetical protein